MTQDELRVSLGITDSPLKIQYFTFYELIFKFINCLAVGLVS